jgi:hypothetical protein
MILKEILLIICWGIILFIKKGRFAEFISDLRSSDKPKWKIWAALFYKSPWFFVTFIGNFLTLLGIMADKHKNINPMFNFLPLKSNSIKPQRVFRMDHGLGPWGRMSTYGTKVPPLFSPYRGQQSLGPSAAVVYSTITYAIPLAIWVWGINGPQKGKSGD